MAKKILKDSDLDKLLKSDRADGLIILNPEDAEAVRSTIQSLRPEPAKKATKKARK